MALQWMPPPFRRRRTSWRFASEEHTLIHWVCSGTPCSGIGCFIWQSQRCEPYHINTLPDVMELRDEAITVQTMTPMKAHVAAFTAMWHSNPTTGDGEPWHSSPPISSM